MDRSQELLDEFKELTANVYFQPPADVQMQYPCIVFELDDIDTKFADNMPYNQADRYSVQVLDYDPASELAHKVAQRRMTRFSRHFVAAQLHHFNFNTYF